MCLDEHANGVLYRPLHQFMPELGLALVAGSQVVGLVFVYFRKEIFDLGDSYGRKQRVVHRLHED